MLKTVICMLAAIIMAQPCYRPSVDDEIPPIIFETLEGNGNRGPTAVQGFVDINYGQVVLSFAMNLGNAEVCIENLDTGFSTVTAIVASKTLRIPFLIASGRWIVTISVSEGPTFAGHFEI